VPWCILFAENAFTPEELQCVFLGKHSTKNDERTGEEPLRLVACSFDRMELTARPRNSIFLITPYWHHGTWVFDDPAVGLVREPFVSGVPDILSRLVSEIPESKKGFRLYFSEDPFPEWQALFIKIRQEYGGVWYRSENDQRSEGWLCPALFKYFSQAPERIYIKAERL
jgi:hypothetical protein